MKTPTFDQLKSMLKSMSYSIFTRLRIVEKDINGIKAMIPAAEKEIIFTKGEDGNYSCNIPHAELWEMDADIIGKNACIVIGNDVYGVRGASKKDNPPLYRNVIQVSADLNVGKYDIPGLYHKTLILSYFSLGLDGKTTMIIPDEVSSLSNSVSGISKLHIPVLESNGVWRNGPAEFLEYDTLSGNYYLKTMSETTKGGAKVGKGLKMDGDALTVDEGEWVMLERIIVGYELLTAQPADWGTNWTAYYMNAGTAVSPVYRKLTDATAPAWKANTFYSFTGNGLSAITRTTEPDGKLYKLDALKVFVQAAIGQTESYYLFTIEDEDRSRIWFGSTKAKANGNTNPDWYSTAVLVLQPTYAGMHSLYTLSSTQGSYPEIVMPANGSGEKLKLNKKIMYLNVSMDSGTLIKNSKIEIWGVRANV